MTYLWCPKVGYRTNFLLCSERCPKSHAKRLQVVEGCLECSFEPIYERKVNKYKEKKEKGVLTCR